MIQFSANLGFLWTELSLPDAVRAAARAGFDAVECHDPFHVPLAEMRAALDETGLPLLSLNTVRGNVRDGENGLAAVPQRADAARAAILQAIEYAKETGARRVHVMAGRASGQEAYETYCANLRFAAEAAAAHEITILIEPLNAADAPGYFLGTTGQAAEIIGALGLDNLKLMFDCYHVQKTEGNVAERFASLLPIIGHVQIAAVPGRGEPSTGELDYAFLLRRFRTLGYDGAIGAEYRPQGKTEDSLGWLAHFKAF